MTTYSSADIWLTGDEAKDDAAISDVRDGMTMQAKRDGFDVVGVNVTRTPLGERIYATVYVTTAPKGMADA